MHKPIAFGSSSTGNLDGFAAHLVEQPETVSVTVDDGMNFEDKSSYRVLHQIEPPEILNCVDKIIENYKFYDLILGWNERILALPNARLFPQGVCTWMEFCYLPWMDMKFPKQMECDETKKKFQISFLTSNKGWAPGHALRQEIYKRLPEQIGDLKVHKLMSPPWIPDKRAILEEYQFTITPQNASHNNWFDDKIIDSLVAKTIPLYWGCPNISNFFNMDGIIHFETVEQLMDILPHLTPEYYMEHYDAVRDNFARAMTYVHVWSRMDVEITAGIARRDAGGWRHTDSEPVVKPVTVVPPVVTPQLVRPLRRTRP
jgi:hypothetical protein